MTTIRAALGGLGVAAALCAPIATPAAVAQPASPLGISLQGTLTSSGAPGGLARVSTIAPQTVASGKANLATGEGVRDNVKFRAGSVTKSFVAATVLLLESEGKLSIDDPVSKWLPGRFPAAPGVTVRQLLQHTSGLPDYLPKVTPGNEYTPEQLLDTIKNDRLQFAPGEGWGYAATNYVALGLVIKAATKQDWRDSLRRLVFKRLGLEDTIAPGRDKNIHGRFILRGYDKKPDGSIADVTVISPTIGDAAGELISTTEDLNKFFGALASGRLLPPAQQQKLLQTVDVPGQPGVGYGLGVFRYSLPCGQVVLGHGGTGPGYTSFGFANLATGKAISAAVNLTATLSLTQTMIVGHCTP